VQHLIGTKSHKARNIAIAVLAIIIILLLILTVPNGLNTIGISIPFPKINMSFFSNLFSGLQSLTTHSKLSHLTIYFSTHNQYILGLGNRTIINISNTTISLASGKYQFMVGSTNTINNIAETDLYAYNMSIYNTTALMAVKENNTIQWLNTGNGTFSVNLVRQILGKD